MNYTYSITVIGAAGLSTKDPNPSRKFLVIAFISLAGKKNTILFLFNCMLRNSRFGS